MILSNGLTIEQNVRAAMSNKFISDELYSELMKKAKKSNATDQRFAKILENAVADGTVK